MPASSSWPTRRSSGPAPATPRPARRTSGRPTSASWRRADEVRRLKVRANADTPGQSNNAIERGAEGIGLCRTEHMFLGEERVAAVRTMIFASSADRGAGRLRHPAAAAARRLRRHLRGHGRQAGHRAPPRPAPARVPARPGRPGRRRRPGHPAGRDDGGGRRGRAMALDEADRDAGQGQRPARDQPDAGAARGAPWDRQAGAVRHAGPGHLSRPPPRSRPTAATRSWRS